MAEAQTSDVDKKTCTSQRGAMKFSTLIDLQWMDNFEQDHFCEKPKIRMWTAVECQNSYFYAVNS
jgi:hypothetical protein